MWVGAVTPQNLGCCCPCPMCLLALVLGRSFLGFWFPNSLHKRQLGAELGTFRDLMIPEARSF